MNSKDVQQVRLPAGLDTNEKLHELKAIMDAQSESGPVTLGVVVHVAVANELKRRSQKHEPCKTPNQTMEER